MTSQFSIAPGDKQHFWLFQCILNRILPHIWSIFLPKYAPAYYSKAYPSTVAMFFGAVRWVSSSVRMQESTQWFPCKNHRLLCKVFEQNFGERPLVHTFDSCSCSYRYDQLDETNLVYGHCVGHRMGFRNASHCQFTHSLHSRWPDLKSRQQPSWAWANFAFFFPSLRWLQRAEKLPSLIRM